MSFGRYQLSPRDRRSKSIEKVHLCLEYCFFEWTSFSCVVRDMYRGKHDISFADLYLGVGDLYRRRTGENINRYQLLSVDNLAVYALARSAD